MKAYQLKIMLKGSKPPIWRRCMVPAGITFSQLSMILNEVMGWQGYHLFSFYFHQSKLMIEEDIDDFANGFLDQEEAQTTYIDEYLDQEAWFTYTYDFGDDWEHRVEVEKIMSDYSLNYPAVLKYKGNCPLEDSGGIYGFNDKQEILKDPDHPEHKEILEWAGRATVDLDYDIAEVNGLLKECYFFMIGDGENRPQYQIFEDFEREHYGIKVARAIPPKNKKIKKGLKLQTYQEMINQMAALTRDLERYQAGYPNQIEVSKEYKLQDILESYTKQDLLDIAREKEMKGYSKYKKKRLAEKIAEFMLNPEEMRRYFYCFSDEQIQSFERAVRAKDIYEEQPDDNFDRVYQSGYIGMTSNDGFMVPQDVADLYQKINKKELEQTRKQRSALLDCFRAARVLYGIVPITEMLNLFNSYWSEPVDVGQLIAEFEQIPLIFQDFVLIGDHFYHRSLYPLDRGLLKAQGDRAFYYPSREEIGDLAAFGCLPNDPYLKQLTENLVRQMRVDPDIAEMAAIECQQEICSGGSMQDVMDLLVEYGIADGNLKKLERLAGMLTEFWNHTRMLLNRGFRPSELRQNEQAADNIIKFPTARGDKIYPNDPCPCGSGKKYKQCCKRK